ncbi:hypothetical protein LIER_38308 [Lithospermum erythrorhizon]|uniref:Uncharacterized protein n=1 Tax=Lithospermum erythrorhizon TaxID=34254 RepID=A0AAV3PXW9_LITER
MGQSLISYSAKQANRGEGRVLGARRTWVPYADQPPRKVLRSGPESGKLALDQELYHDMTHCQRLLRVPARGDLGKRRCERFHTWTRLKATRQFSK